MDGIKVKAVKLKDIGPTGFIPMVLPCLWQPCDDHVHLDSATYATLVEMLDKDDTLKAVIALDMLWIRKPSVFNNREEVPPIAPVCLAHAADVMELLIDA